MLNYKIIAIPIETIGKLRDRVLKDPKDYVSLYRLGELCERRDSFSLEMLDAYTKAEDLVRDQLERTPDDPSVNYHYARIWIRSWKREFYSDKIRNALEIALDGYLEMFYKDPDNRTYHKIIEDICSKIGSHEKEIEMFLHLLSINPRSSYAMDKLAHAYYMGRDGSEAISVLERLVEIYPDFAEAYRFMGIIYYYQIRDYQKARENLEKYLELNPKDIRIRQFLATVNQVITTGFRIF